MSDRFFGEMGRHWDVLREESYGSRFHLEALTALLPSDWTVADIGAGTGYLLPALATHFHRVIGVEPVEAMLEAARQRVLGHGLVNVELLTGDLTRLPIGDSSVDVAVAVLVLHHVSAPQEALRELHRIIRAGGRALIVEHTAHRNEAFRDRMQDRWWGFAPDEFMSMLASAGFRESSLHGLSSVDHAPDAPDLFVVVGRKAGQPEHLPVS
jgi:ArsR family transcriptional regulator